MPATHCSVVRTVLIWPRYFRSRSTNSSSLSAGLIASGPISAPRGTTAGPPPPPRPRERLPGRRRGELLAAGPDDDRYRHQRVRHVDAGEPRVEVGAVAFGGRSLR